MKCDDSFTILRRNPSSMVRNEGPLGTSTTWRVHFGGSRMMTNAEKGANLAARTAVEDFDPRDEVLSQEFRSFSVRGRPNM